VSRELDELYARVDRIEHQLAAPRTFARAELDRQRRAAVLHARRQGLSIAMIASALGLGRSTVATILDGEQVAGPERVLGLGLDGKSHPARHVENGRNGGRAQA
jgi:Homeodomain-like domain